MSVVAVPVLPEGAVIAGDYEVVSLLSRSRAFDVYEVISESRDCGCVAKVVRPDRAHEERVRSRLLEEGRMLLSFTHPHLVRAYEVLDEPEDPVVILETLPGETLEHVLARPSRRMPVADLGFLGMHLCSALHYLHGKGIVHLDLKPANVVVDRGIAKVFDLSIARPPGPIRPGAGTKAYMSPEQARGGDVGPAADVWGIGVVLHQAATGERPFTTRLEGHDQLERRATPAARLRPRLPAAIATAIDAALDPDPDARPAVWELAEALDWAIPD